MDIVELGDHSIGWVGDDSAQDTSGVTGQESDSQLSGLSIAFSWVGPDGLVEEGDTLFEEDELHDSVWDLSEPQWGDSLEETRSSFVLVHGGQSLSECSWESSWLGSLHFDLAGLEWAQENIGEEFGGSRGGSPDEGLVLLVSLFSQHSRVGGLEDLIESELTNSLQVVSNESWSPSLI